MKVMLFAYESPEGFALRDDKQKFDGYMGAWYAFGEAMRKADVYDSGEALEPPETATVVSVRDGVRKVEDGPFPDAKEQLGGFCIIDVADMKEAEKWAAKCPSVNTAHVDLRPVPFLEAGDDQ